MTNIDPSLAGGREQLDPTGRRGALGAGLKEVLSKGALSLLEAEGGGPDALASVAQHSNGFYWDLDDPRLDQMYGLGSKAQVVITAGQPIGSWPGKSVWCEGMTKPVALGNLEEATVFRVSVYGKYDEGGRSSLLESIVLDLDNPPPFDDGVAEAYDRVGAILWLLGIDTSQGQLDVPTDGRSTWEVALTSLPPVQSFLPEVSQ